MKEDAGRGWRRVVPSPEPSEIVELEAVRGLVRAGCLVVCSGGGGVPVVRSRGALSGIDAVIDKDLAAALLAKELGADALLILTDVPKAYVHYGTPEQTALDTVTASQMRAYAAEGHFKAGSMGPKVEACLRFVDAGGEIGDRQPHRGRPGDGRTRPARTSCRTRRRTRLPEPQAKKAATRKRRSRARARRAQRRGSHRHLHRSAASGRRMTYSRPTAVRRRPDNPRQEVPSWRQRPPR